MRDENHVSWARWDAAHQALAARVSALEESGAVRRNHVWLLILGVLTGVVAPLVATAILAWVHLRGG